MNNSKYCMWIYKYNMHVYVYVCLLVLLFMWIIDSMRIECIFVCRGRGCRRRRLVIVLDCRCGFIIGLAFIVLFRSFVNCWLAHMFVQIILLLFLTHRDCLRSSSSRVCISHELAKQWNCARALLLFFALLCGKAWILCSYNSS